MEPAVCVGLVHSTLGLTPPQQRERESEREREGEGWRGREMERES